MVPRIASAGRYARLSAASPDNGVDPAGADCRSALGVARAARGRCRGRGSVVLGGLASCGRGRPEPMRGVCCAWQQRVVGCVGRLRISGRTSDQLVARSCAGRSGNRRRSVWVDAGPHTPAARIILSVALTSVDRFRLVRRPQEEAPARASTARCTAQNVRAFTVLVRNAMFRRAELAALRRTTLAKPGPPKRSSDKPICGSGPRASESSAAPGM
jgi:hypothetical protein